MNIMPITMSDSGKTVTIVNISGNPKVRQHLSELGFVTGEKVMVVNNIGGNVIVQVKDARIAVDEAMARRIMVG